MTKLRMIPCLLLRNGRLVQSRGFSRYQVIGSPTAAAKRLNVWASDELVYLDISPDSNYDLRRNDLNYPNRGTFLDIIRDVAKGTFMPMTVGGGVRTIEDIRDRLAAGADKVTINSKAIDEPAFITDAAGVFGSQCVVVSIDAKQRPEGGWQVYRGGRTPSPLDAVAWAREAEQRGAGEIFLNSIDRDGMGTGYDLDLVRAVCEAVTIPVIACGGVGNWDHLAEGLRAGASAVAAANIFQYTEQSVLQAKRHLYDAGLDVRPPELVHDTLRDPSSVANSSTAMRMHESDPKTR